MLFLIILEHLFEYWNNSIYIEHIRTICPRLNASNEQIAAIILYGIPTFAHRTFKPVMDILENIRCQNTWRVAIVLFLKYQVNDAYEIAYIHYAVQIPWVRITWIKMGFDEMIWNLIRPSTIEDNLSFLDRGIVLSPKIYVIRSCQRKIIQ